MALSANSERFKGKPKTKIKLVDTEVGWSKRVGAYTRRFGGCNVGQHCCSRKRPVRAPIGGGAGQVAGENPRIELQHHDEDAPAVSATLDEHPKPEVGAGEQTSLTCVREVEENFVGLVRYNKLQLFYIGTLIYSVMNIAFIFYSSSATLTATTWEPNPLTGNGARKWQAPPPDDSAAATSTAAAAANYLTPPPPPTPIYELRAKPVRLHPQVAHLLLATLLPLTLLLGLIAAITALHFGAKRRPTANKSGGADSVASAATTTTTATTLQGAASSRRLQAIGLILSLLLLYLPLLLPVALNHLVATPAGTTNEAVSLPISLASHLPLGSVLALVYLQPQLLEATPLSAKLVCALLSLLPLAGLALLRLATLLMLHLSSSSSSSSINQHRRRWPPDFRPPSQLSALGDDAGQVLEAKNQYHAERHLSSEQLYQELSVLFALALPLAFALGLLKRRHWQRSLLRDTFEGAAELIEAKVSLEHQRQQQETLLLSVLPAYVAEQVKRNMLKKTNTALIVQQSSPQTTANNQAPETDHPTMAATTATPFSTLGALMAAGSWQVRVPNLSGVAVSQEDAAAEERGFRGGRLHASLASCSSVEPSGISSNNQLTPGVAPHLSLTKTNSAQSATQQEVARANSINHLAAGVPPAQQSQPSGTTGSQARRGFNELYIRTYNNVSLLYGDIVGFTRLCTQLSSSQLVRVLNDLFSHFDYLAEKHKIMRIKILGDCYYGVSGIPEFAVMGAKSRASSRNDNHAVNCVNMGLDMIHYIRCLNVERASCSTSTCDSTGEIGGLTHSRSAHATASPSEVKQQPQIAKPSTSNNLCEHSTTSIFYQDNPLSSATGHNSPLPQFELNMRIGVHTGHIHSGVIGLKKWQFDVWSNDVSIAMHSESSGIPGRVQVTEATLTQLNGAFSYESAPGCLSDPFLSSNDIRTYLIRERVRSSPVHLQQPPAPSGSDKKRGTGGAGEEPHDEDNIRAATIGTIRQTLLAADNSSGHSYSGSVAFNHHDLTWLTLSYRDAAMRKLHQNQPTAHLLTELFRLQLLVGILLPLLLWRLPGLGAPVAMLLATCVLLFILISTFARSSLVRDEQVASNSGGSSTSGGNNTKCGHLFSSSPVNRETVLHRKWSAIRRSTLVRQLTCGLRKRLFEPLAPVRQRSALRSAATALVLIAVILVQLLLLIKRTCRPWPEVSGSSLEGDRAVAEVATGELYQLTVILLLLSIDSSVHLLSFKIKCCLLITSLSLHLMLMLRPEALLHYTVCRLESKPVVVYHQRDQVHDEQVITLQQVLDWSSNLIILLLAVCSFGFARQLDYNNKTSFLWRNRLSVDHEELEYISGINKLLLENILPSHVVQHYLTQPSCINQPAKSQLPSLQSYMRMSFSNMRTINNELYHEQHEHVAVMFASIPHFYEFYDESDISKQGLGCIALLNEIICDFDKLLLKNKFSRIEKIKTIGSTYMAAAGLRPCYLSASRGSSASNQSNLAPSTGGYHHQQQQQQQQQQTQVFSRRTTQSARLSSGRKSSSLMDTISDERKLALSQQKLNLICMIQFASSLMSALNGINKQSFQVFKLRVGVNTGSVIAGVIGAQRPFYDIWGDCVNIASRMESLGEVGRIQVEERTARLLMENLCSDSYSIVKRGPIDVKGKGGMLTYFVDKKNAEPQVTLATTTATRQQKSQQPMELQQQKETGPQKTEVNVSSENCTDIGAGCRRC